MNKQMSLSALSDELSQVRTKKREFLAEIDRIVPWGEWISLIRPYYYKGERGNKPYDLERMLRIYLVQNLYNLSDMATVAEVIDSRAFSDFCGVESSNQVPDGDTLGRFRNILLKNGIQQELFAQVVELLTQRGLILKRGTIVDSTFIEAPSSTKNQKKERDPEAHSAKKGNVWYFGYKAHIGVDSESGLVHTVQVTAANVHDVCVTADLLTGEEEQVYGDSGYLGAEKRPEARKKNTAGKKIRYKINRHPSQSKNNSARSQAQIDQCDAAGIYYAVATGTLTDEQYEEYKDYEFYVGAIGPSMDIEFKAGYEMAAYYIDNGMTKFGMFGGGVPYYVDMHIYRAAGILTAMVEKGGEGANYKGADNAGAILGQIYADGGIETGAIGNLELVAYVGGYDFNDARFGKLAQMVGTEGIQAILTVGSGVDVLGGFIAGSGVKLATVDSFTPAMKDAMDNGILDYMAGKFAASIGRIFAATLNVINGQPIRDNDGNALALGQGYWVATNSDQFAEYSAVDSSLTDPAYTKEILDQFAAPGVSYDDFAAFVAQYAFDEIVALKK